MQVLQKLTRIILTYRQLQAQRTDLEAQIAAIQAQGDVLLDARIDSSIPGGVIVRGNPSTQYRLRVKGQKARHLKASEVAETRAAIARGKQLKKLQRELERVQAQIGRIVAKATELGLELPD